MPSFQHSLLKLSATNLRLMADMDLTNVPSLRRTLDLSASALTPPSGLPIKPIRIGELEAEWTAPLGSDPEQIILYLHGGGYTVGSINTHRGLVAKLAVEANIQALSVDYRLAPEHPFPAALEDAVHAYHFLLDRGFSPDQIVVVGDSAGGGLTMALLLCLKDMQIELPAGAVLFSPWVDLSFSGASAITHQVSDPIVMVPKVRSWGQAYAKEYPLTHPMLSPLYGNLKGLPPILIQVSDAEVLTDDSLRLASALEDAGTLCDLQVWEGLLHVWQLFWRYIPEGREAVDHAVGFIERQLAIGRQNGHGPQPVNIAV